MKKLIKHSFANLASFIKMYIDAAKTIDSKKPLKVVDYEICSKTGEVKLYVQIYPTSTIVNYSPAKLINDDETLSGFSALDVRTIAFFAFRDLGLLKTYKYSICRIFTSGEDSTSHTVEYKNEFGKTFQSDIAKLASSENILNDFSPLESYLIGYSMCEDSLLKESFYKKYAEVV